MFLSVRSFEGRDYIVISTQISLGIPLWPKDFFRSKLDNSLPTSAQFWGHLKSCVLVIYCDREYHPKLTTIILLCSWLEDQIFKGWAGCFFRLHPTPAPNTSGWWLDWIGSLRQLHSHACCPGGDGWVTELSLPLLPIQAVLGRLSSRVVRLLP